MSGTTIPLFSKRPFTFTLVGNGSQTIIITKAIDVSQYTSGTLEVRLHSNGTASGAHIFVEAYTTAPTPEDPTENFVVSGTPVASVDITTQSAPLLIVDALDANFGGMLMIAVRATQPGSPVACTAELSAVLTVKS